MFMIFPQTVRIRRMPKTTQLVRKRHLGILCILFYLSMVGCASVSAEYRSTFTPEPGTTSVAEKGGALLIREQGEVLTNRKWVGTTASPTGWEAIDSDYGDDYRREEIIYIGINHSLVRLVYRVFKGGSEDPVEMEQLLFDIAQSNIIQVKDVRLKILKADYNAIHYLVLEQ